MKANGASRSVTCVYTGGGRQSRRQRAYSDLKWRLLLGEFPAGERLGEERLAALLGVSRTPVREALARLHSENLVMPLADGGYGPVVPDLGGVRDLYEVRMALELKALQRPDVIGVARDWPSLDGLAELWERYRAEVPEPDPAFVVADEHFHVTLARSGGNLALVDLLETVNGRIRSIRMRDFLTSERIVATIEEHVAILEALRGGEIESARAALTDHLRQSMDVASARAADALERMAKSQEATSL